MSTSYSDLIANDKTFIGNVVIQFLGQYFTIHVPDSGLYVKPEYQGLVVSMIAPPTSIDPRRVSTTIAENSFKILDKNGVLTALIKERGQNVIGQTVNIWIGRCGVDQAFSDYLQLPATTIKKLTHTDNSYAFASYSDSDRMNKEAFTTQTRLLGDIFPGTNSFQVKDDISLFPASGGFKIDNEFMTYSSKDDTLKTFSGVVRGLFSTTASAHTDDSSISISDFVVANPLTILLNLLTSKGGGSLYDILQDGVGLDQNLIDIADIENTRDTLFASTVFSLGIYAVSNILLFIEDEILFPNNLRFTYSANSKLTVAVLDKAKFVDMGSILNENSLVGYPKWSSDGQIVVNNLQISWDFNEDTGIYNQIQVFQDAASIAANGLRNQVAFAWHGVKTAQGGAAFVTKFKNNYFERLSVPSPEVQVNTQMDKSLLNIGNKTVLQTRFVPSENGNLNFNSELEVISRSVNWETGDVILKLQFTSFTGTRSCYLAPSDTIIAVVSQKKVTLGAGRGLYYQVGWKLRLWNNNTPDYETDPVNEIVSIVGDDITFLNNFATTLTTHHRLKFCTYDDATAEQKRYCFITPTGASQFADGGKPYRIVP